MRVFSGSVLPGCVNIEVIFGITLIISTRHDADADDDHDDRVDHRALDLRLSFCAPRGSRRGATGPRRGCRRPRRRGPSRRTARRTASGASRARRRASEPSLTAARTSESGALKRTFVDLLDERAERLGERDARVQQRRQLARERRDLDLLDAAEDRRRGRRPADRPPFVAFVRLRRLAALATARTLVTNTPSLRSTWRSAFGDSASCTPSTFLPLGAEALVRVHRHISPCSPRSSA